MTHTEHAAASSARMQSLPSEGYAGRAESARADRMAVRPLRDDRYVVETGSGTYVVDLIGRSCTCPDHAIRGARCKHLRRVAIEVNEGRAPPPGRRAAVCAVCGARTFVPVRERGPYLCPRHELAPGEVVSDREDGSLLVVTGRRRERADESTTDDGRVIAEFESNEGYGGHEPVIEAVYLGSVRPRDGRIDASGLRRYGFPASRLRRVERERGRLDFEGNPDADDGPSADSDADGSTRSVPV